MRLPVTYLFVPGNRPERFDKAMDAGADAVILDLEDAVAPREKEAARECVARWLAAHPDRLDERVVVRVNAASTPWFAADAELVRERGVRAAMLPKCESAEPIDALRSAMSPEGRIIPFIENARGVSEARGVASAAGVQRIAFGTFDYAADLDLGGGDEGLAYPSSQIAIESRRAGIASPIAGVTLAIDDGQRLRADVAFARAHGFGAKLCIHPKQVAIVRDAFRPPAEEIEWARRVIAAAEGARGAVQVDGRMVDEPVVLKAKATLARAS
jgi:citrate lyase subunit beta/citryl-CoA lyase